MKFRTFISALVAFAGALVIVGLGLFAGLTLNSPLALIESGGRDMPAALQFVPKQSPLVASALVRPDRLSDLWQYLAAPSLRKTAQQDIRQLEQAFLAGTDLTYRRDIAPWLGDEITAAVVSLDLDQDAANGRQAGYLVALSCADSQAAKAMLELFWQNRAIAGDALTFEDFSGTRLIYAQARPAGKATQAATAVASGLDQLATALVANRFVLVANHPQVLRQAVTAAQSSDLNLQADSRYRQALQALPKKRIGLLAFTVPPEIPGQTPAATDISSEAWPSLELETLGQPGETVDWGLMSLTLARQGILADVALLATRGHQLEPRPIARGRAFDLAEKLPADLAMAATGQNLEAMRTTLQPLIAAYANYGGGVNPLADRLGPDLAKQVIDVLQQGVQKGYGLGLQLKTPPSQGLDWTLIAEHTPAIEASLQQLTDLAQNQGLSTGTLPIDSQAVTVWTSLSLASDSRGANPTPATEIITQVAGLHTQIADYDVLATSPRMMEAVLANGDANGRQPVRWKSWSGLLAQPNEGYVYLNWPALESGLSRQDKQFRWLTVTAKPFLKHLRTVTLTSYGRTETLQTGGIFFELSNG
jgi:hypothetical protein